MQDVLDYDSVIEMLKGSQMSFVELTGPKNEKGILIHSLSENGKYVDKIFWFDQVC